MRTTLDIDDDILETAKKMAEFKKVSTGRVISEIFRRGLERPDSEPTELRNGFPQFRRSGVPITVEMVENLLEEEDREIIRQAFRNS